MDERPDVAELVEHVPTNRWRELGLQLGISENLLEEIKLSHYSIANSRQEMYSVWLRTTPQASRKQVLSALKKTSVAEAFMAETYCKYILQLSHGMQLLIAVFN